MYIFYTILVLVAKKQPENTATAQSLLQTRIALRLTQLFAMVF